MTKLTNGEAAEVLADFNPYEKLGAPAGTTHTGNVERAKTLEFAAQARARDLVRHEDGLGWEFTIPPLDFVFLTTKDPELISTDAATHKAAWLRFQRSPEAEQYRVHRTSRRREFNGIIVK